jgi:hypothetical protein
VRKTQAKAWVFSPIGRTTWCCLNPEWGTSFPIWERGVPLLQLQRRTTMSTNTNQTAVCRLLGGSGRAQLIAVPVPKIAALFAPSKAFEPATRTVPLELPLAA